MFPQAIKGDKDITSRLKDLFDEFFSECLYIIRRECKQMVLTSENNYIISFLNIINAMFSKAKPNEFGEVNTLEVDKIGNCLELIVV